MVLHRKILAFNHEMLDTHLILPGKDLSLLFSHEWDPFIRSLLELEDPAHSQPVRIVSALGTFRSDHHSRRRSPPQASYR